MRDAPLLRSGRRWRETQAPKQAELGQLEARTIMRYLAINDWLSGCPGKLAWAWLGSGMGLAALFAWRRRKVQMAGMAV